MSKLLSMVALASIAVAGPAWAKENMEVVQARVSYADLDLSDPAHVAKLQQRIDRKARQICASGYDSDLRTPADVQSCRASVVESVKGQIDCAAQVAMRQGKSRRS